MYLETVKAIFFTSRDSFSDSLAQKFCSTTLESSRLAGLAGWGTATRTLVQSVPDFAGERLEFWRPSCPSFASATLHLEQGKWPIRSNFSLHGGHSAFQLAQSLFYRTCGGRRELVAFIDYSKLEELRWRRIEHATAVFDVAFTCRGFEQ